jgi:hypothetical protein
MNQSRCEIRDVREAQARDAVAYEKELESQLPEPGTRKDAHEQVEIASFNLKNHIKSCPVCNSTSA